MFISRNLPSNMDLKVLTLNCWGLPVVAKNRKQRIQAIAEVIAGSQYDVVCLQEVWLDKDFIYIKEKVKNSLPFSHYFYSGVTGSGVCALSKHQILDVFYHQWPVNGYIHKIHHGDWFGGKGVGLCCFSVKDFKINIYSTHLHAEYNRSCDEYQAHRVLQAFDTAQFIQLTSGSCNLVVLAGDLNTEPGDLAYRILLNISGCKDSFVEARGEQEDCLRFGTNETCENSYTPKSLVKKGFPGKRIDYIMYRTNENTNVTLKKYCLPLPDRVPNCNFSYSDHEAISADFYLENKYKIEDKDYADSVAVLKEAIELCNDALSNLKTTAIIYWFLSAFLFLLLVSSIPFDAPLGYRYIIHIVRGLLTLLMTFTIIMGSLWHRIETHGILSGKLAMETTLKKHESLN